MRTIMATTSTPVGFTAATTRTTPAKPGFFARFLARMIEARTRRAEMHVQPYLARLSDDRLQELGFKGEYIERLRERHVAQALYWS